MLQKYFLFRRISDKVDYAVFIYCIIHYKCQINIRGIRIPWETKQSVSAQAVRREDKNNL
jgi:hypothetical protein